MENETHSGKRLSREKILRVYLSGFASLAIIYVAWRVLEQFSPPLFLRGHFGKTMTGADEALVDLSP